MHAFKGGMVVVLVSLGGLSARGGDDKGKFELSPLEKEVLELTNEERKKKELPPLRPDPLLFKVARGHSDNMAKQSKMEHVLDGKTPFDRLREARYPYTFAGENIAYGLNTPVKEIFQGWMESPKHRDNILNDRFTEIGIGAVKDKEGTIWYTQVFGKPQAGK
jgi:uncharacterized protein YkwD